MIENKYQKGSEWRKWDLHVHSPASKSIEYTGDYDKLIDNINKCDADVIGINDYYTIDGYSKIINENKIKDKILFPVVEFRMNNILKNKHNTSEVKLNFHIIFNNKIELISKINTWLKSLVCFTFGGQKDKLGNIKEDDFSKISFDYIEIINSLRSDINLKDNYLSILPYDEYGGIDEIDPKNDGYFKNGLINYADILGSSTKKQIDFFLWKHKIFDEVQFKKWFDIPKPCIKGSDSHNSDYPIGHLKNEKSQAINKFCWLKANPTFEGLKQIIYEPESRVFIGEKPEILERLEGEPSKFIKSIDIRKIDSSNLKNEDWFDKVHIDFNPELIAIIGKKGSGKSALLDILGITIRSKRYKQFSFLTNERFYKHPNRAKEFKASITTYDSLKSKEYLLTQVPEEYEIEKAKYIPQNYLENLCNSLDKNGEESNFQEQLKDVIFSHIDIQDRNKKNSLRELENYKTEIINKSIFKLQSDLKTQIDKLIQLDLKSTDDYLKSLELKLKIVEKDLEQHEKTIPVDVPKPKDITTDKNSKEILIDIEKKEKSLNELIKKIQDNTNKIIELKIVEQDLTDFYSELSDLLQSYEKIKDTYSEKLLKTGIKFDDIVKLNINKIPLQSKIKDYKKEIKTNENSLDTKQKNSIAWELKTIEKSIKELREKLDEPTRNYQIYKDKLKEWEDKKKKILGSVNTEGSKIYLEYEINYIKTKLKEEILNSRNICIKKMKEIYFKKVEIKNTFKELYKPVDDFIKNQIVDKSEYKINFDVKFNLRDFNNDILNFINKNKEGSFYGIDQAHTRLRKILEPINFDDVESIKKFINTFLNNFDFDRRNEEKEKTVNNITLQIKDLKGFYETLFNLDYLIPQYQLKLGDKELNELSPGEKGALLLIFYLMIDKNDYPLIIDQPEENLDNESVYNILVKHIKLAKKKRQLFIVTHNPNLAVVCDAEQIIVVNINKKNKNKFEYEIGSICDEKINLRIIDILEGTLPAFNTRDNKYSISKRLKIV